MKLIYKLLIGLLAVILLAAGSFVLFGMYLTKKLPWQHPVFDTQLPPDPGNLGERGVLVFYKTNGFEHASIGDGIREITSQGESRGWNVVSTNQGSFFNDAYLKKFKVVVFLNTTGDILTKEQEVAFEKYIQNGGGYAGIHAASDTEYEWDWYDTFVGTHFRDHSLFPHTPQATLLTDNQSHPSTRHLPKKWNKVEEWYNFKRSVRDDKEFDVLLSVDESTFDVGETGGMNSDHPISWVNKNKNGRMFYTALGHTSETFTDKNAMTHLLNGIEWAGKLKE